VSASEDRLAAILDEYIDPWEVRPALAILARPANHEALVRWAGDTIGLDTLMRALVDAYGPASIVASMVEVGALERVTHEYLPEFSEPCENCNGCGQAVSPSGVDFCHCCDGSGLDEAIYRTGDRRA
jgi:hypothetical protein